MKTKPIAVMATVVIFLLSSKLVLAHVSVDKDTRAMWNGIRDIIYEHVGDAPYEIVAVHANYDGLAFYSDGNVECLGFEKKPSSYIPAEAMDEEYDELLSTAYVHIFLTSNKYKENVLAELRKRGFEYSVSEAPFDRFLIFCNTKERHEQESVVRLAVLGNAGTGESGQKLLGSALYQIDQNISLDGILLSGDNITRWNGHGDVRHAYRKSFEEPYAPLLGNKVPFYAALGDTDTASADYQIQYPLFNMNGRRYYSMTFGPNRVEVFFLDSNTIKEDPVQIEWLSNSLRDSTAEWKLVIMHHPMHSTAKKSGSDASMIRLLEPIFIETGVDLVIYGHNHVYERLRPINGIQYMTVGSSGKLDFHRLASTAPERIAGNDEENALLILQFTDTGCHFTAYTMNEKILDQGEIEYAPAPHFQ